MYLPESNGSILLTPRNLSGGETNVFEKAFNNEIDMESWQDWMRWDGSGEIDFPMLDGKENLSTHIPLPRQLPTDVATTRDQTMTTSLPEQENSFEDAPFEFDDTQTQQQMDTIHPPLNLDLAADSYLSPNPRSENFKISQCHTEQHQQ
jgi:hypothetical protein